MSVKRVLNFNSGPAAMPEEVLQQAAQAVLEYENTGMSIMELPHRGKHFDNILAEAAERVYRLCNISADEYEVLWLQGGGRLQFCMVPMNFLGENETAGYLDSGHWASDALENAQFYGKVNVLASTKDINYTALPNMPDSIPEDLSYIHITSNNTIFGTQYAELPHVTAPLIVDMSSDILGIKRDFSKCAMFYAVVQKNLGAAGVTLVVIRKDLLKSVKRKNPAMLDYNAHAKANSVLNTPPVTAVYTSLLMLRWIEHANVDSVYAANTKKAQLLYEEIERNSLFSPIVEKDSRSTMNVVFSGNREGLEKMFSDYCATHNITGVKGHRSVGGFRVSLYNTISVSDVEKLVAVMKDYEQQIPD